MGLIRTLSLLPFALFLVSASALGQPDEGSGISTSGACSPIVEGTEGNVTIKITCELTSEQLEQLKKAITSAMPNILNPPLPTDPFNICILSKTERGLTVNSFTFPFSDIAKGHSDGRTFIMLLKKLPGVSLEEIDNSSIFRYADEQTIAPESGSPLGNGNKGVIVIPNSIIDESFDKDAHIAFTYLRSKSKGTCR